MMSTVKPHIAPTHYSASNIAKVYCIISTDATASRGKPENACRIEVMHHK